MTTISMTTLSGSSWKARSALTVAGRDPVVDEIDVPLAARIRGVVLDDGDRPGHGGAERRQQRHGGHEALAEALAEQAVQQKAGERQ